MKRLILISLLLAAAGCDKGSQKAQSASNRPQAEAVHIESLHQEAKDIVKTGLIDDNSYIRSIAVEVVASTKQAEMMPMVETLLSDDKVPIRFAAALAVGDLKYEPAKDAVEHLMSDKNLSVKLAAAYALTELGDKSYGKFFSKALTSNDQTVRANAAFILGNLGDKKALPELHALLRDPSSSEKAMFVAVEAMARLGDESVYSKLWAMLISTYADDRVSGIRAMGALGTIPAKNAIITLLDDKVLEVRLAAAEQLGALGDTSGEPEVLDFFIGKSISDAERTPRAKSLAALAIGWIRTPALLQYLPGLLKDDSIGVRLAAAKAAIMVNTGR